MLLLSPALFSSSCCLRLARFTALSKLACLHEAVLWLCFFAHVVFWIKCEAWVILRRLVVLFLRCSRVNGLHKRILTHSVSYYQDVLFRNQRQIHSYLLVVVTNRNCGALHFYIRHLHTSDCCNKLGRAGKLIWPLPTRSATAHQIETKNESFVLHNVPQTLFNRRSNAVCTIVYVCIWSFWVSAKWSLCFCRMLISHRISRKQVLNGKKLLFFFSIDLHGALSCDHSWLYFTELFVIVRRRAIFSKF